MSKPLQLARASENWRVCGNDTVAAGGENAKGFGKVRLASGEIANAEVHWYEATGIGKREFKIKRFL